METKQIARNPKGYLIAVCMVLIGSQFQNAYAQQPYDTAYQLYYEINKSPSSGDGLIQANQHLFDDRFYGCLSTLQAKFEAAALNQYEYCNNNYVDPADAARCAQENEPAKMHHWLRTIDAVTRGQARWSDTDMGQVQLMAEQLLPPAQYRQIIEVNIPKVRQQLLCQ